MVHQKINGAHLQLHTHTPKHGKQKEKLMSAQWIFKGFLSASVHAIKTRTARKKKKKLNNEEDVDDLFLFTFSFSLQVFERSKQAQPAQALKPAARPPSMQKLSQK